MQVYYSLEGQIFEEMQIKEHALSRESFDAKRAFSRPAFDAVNGLLTHLYSTLNRVHHDPRVLWKPAPRRKRLPDAAVLKAAILQRVADSARYHREVVAGEPGLLQPTDHDAHEDLEAHELENERDAEWYKGKVEDSHVEDIAHTQADVNAFQAQKVDHETLFLMCIAEDNVELLVHEVVTNFYGTDESLDSAADATLQWTDGQVATSAASPDCETQGTVLQQSAEEVAVVSAETRVGPWADRLQDGTSEDIVDLIGMDAPLLQMSEGKESSLEGIHVEVRPSHVEVCSWSPVRFEPHTTLLPCSRFTVKMFSLPAFLTCWDEVVFHTLEMHTFDY